MGPSPPGCSSSPDGVGRTAGPPVRPPVAFSGLAIPPPAVHHTLASYTGFIAIAIPTILIAIATSGLYQRSNLQSVAEAGLPPAHCRRRWRGIHGGPWASLSCAVPTESSRLLIIYFGILSLALTGSGRYMWALWRDFLETARASLARTLPGPRGLGPSAERVVAHLARSPALGYRVVGFRRRARVRPRTEPPEQPAAARPAGAGQPR